MPLEKCETLIIKSFPLSEKINKENIEDQLIQVKGLRKVLAALRPQGSGPQIWCVCDSVDPVSYPLKVRLTISEPVLNYDEEHLYISSFVTSQENMVIHVFVVMPDVPKVKNV